MQSTLIKIDTDSEFVEAENLFIHDPEEPTIVVYEGAQDPAVYEGPLEAHAILEWLKQTIDDPMLQLYVKQLEPTEFVQWARQTTSATYALACTRWSDECREGVVEYEKVAKALRKEYDIIVALIDGDEAMDILKDYGVEVFPTLLYFPKWNPSDHTTMPVTTLDVPLNKEALLSAINEAQGIERRSDGGLLPTAGVVAEMNKIAKKFVFAEEEEQTKLLGEAQGVAAQLSGPQREKANLYVQMMEAGIRSEEPHKFLTGEMRRILQQFKGKQPDDALYEFYHIRSNVLYHLLTGKQPTGTAEDLSEALKPRVKTAKSGGIVYTGPTQEFAESEL